MVLDGVSMALIASACLQYRSKISEPPNALLTRGLEEVNALVLFR